MATGIRQQDREDAIAGWLFMAPALIVLGLFLAAPILFAAYYSLTDWNGISPPAEANYIGFNNYAQLLVVDGIRQADFFRALKNTTYFALGVVPLQTAIALCLAVIINQRGLRFRDFFRTAYYFPAITSSIAISMVFLFLYQRGGLINQVLEAITFGAWEPIAWVDTPDGLIHLLLGGLGVTLRGGPEFLRAEVLGLTVWDWISGPSVALTAIMLMNIWTTIGTMMIIFLAALQDIPYFVYEAAQMDGANAWQIFTNVTLPLLRPTLFFVITLGLIGTYQVFDQVYVMTAGGPAKTTLTMAYIVYRNGFRNSEMGLGLATAVLLFIIIFVLTLLQRRITRTQE
ncbi:MAG TPA: sugar ABC transporter permease [Caldilineaceae bacterium]|nr:sugar ABC transporter permease [Caldilineaceae bacterium]